MKDIQEINNAINQIYREESEEIPIYGLLVINHAYNEGKISFREWLRLTKEWAESMIAKYGKVEGTV